MHRPAKRSMEKFQAMDLSAGIYPARHLTNSRYTHHDFLEYLNTFAEDELDLEFEMDEGAESDEWREIAS